MPSIRLEGLSQRRKELLYKVANLKNNRQLDDIDAITSKSEWQYQVHFALGGRARLNELKGNAAKAMDYIFASEKNTMIKWLMSDDCLKWRPGGIATFAQIGLLYEGLDHMEQVKMLAAVSSAAKMSRKDFMIAYPTATRTSPLHMLETILLDKMEFSLLDSASPFYSGKISARTLASTYDGKREEDI